MMVGQTRQRLCGRSHRARAQRVGARPPKKLTPLRATRCISELRGQMQDLVSSQGPSRADLASAIPARRVGRATDARLSPTFPPSQTHLRCIQERGHIEALKTTSLTGKELQRQANVIAASTKTRMTCSWTPGASPALCCALLKYDPDAIKCEVDVPAHITRQHLPISAPSCARRCPALCS